MTPPYERCVYCHHSHATDIEHFWPKSSYVNRLFDWLNLLLCCTECGRFKGNHFPLDGDRPLLIDPTVDDPWAHIDFISKTGDLTPAFDLSLDDVSPKGRETVRLLKLDARESLSKEYLRSFKSLTRAITEFLERPASEIEPFVNRLLDLDQHGLLGWCLGPRGARASPFADLKARHPDAWACCAERIHR